MAWHLFHAKPLSEPKLACSQLDPKEHNSMKFFWKSIFFIQENAFENISEKCQNHLTLASMY